MILVTGATGNVGRHVVAGLQEVGADVRAMCRDPGVAVLPDGVEVARGDLSSPDTLRACLDGIDTVFLVWPQASASHPLTALDIIARHARRIVYISSLTVDEDREEQTHPMTAIHARIEVAIRRSGLAWTFLRAGKFDTNTRGWAAQIRATGAVRLPYAGAGRSPIHEADLAAVTVRALTDERHGGATHVVTGPELLTEADLVRTIGEVIGRPVRCEEIPPRTARAEMLATGLPPDLVDAALDYWRTLVARPEPVTRTVEQITGAPARTFRDWATEHADDFR